MNRLYDKVAIVTGAGRGIGHAIAERFAAEGASVFATSRTLAEPFVGNVELHRRDVASEADWKRVVEAALEAHGKIDILVNNAGIIAYEAIDELDLEDWNEVIATNQTGTFLGMRTVLPAMRSQRAGSIINVSSIWGNAAIAGAHAYHATKGAVRTMSKNAAITYAESGIRVNSLHPGFTETPLTVAQDAEVNQWVIGQTPMRRAGQPEEIAAAALFLASDEASFVTGSELIVDGGYLAQ